MRVFEILNKLLRQKGRSANTMYKISSLKYFCKLMVDLSSFNSIILTMNEPKIDGLPNIKFIHLLKKFHKNIYMRQNMGYHISTPIS